MAQDVVAEFRKALEGEIPVKIEPKAVEGNAESTN